MTKMSEKARRYELEGRWFRSSEADAVPTFLIGKKDPSKCRHLFDERQRNRNTVRDKTPIPHMENILAAAQAAKHVSTLDMVVAYDQVRVTRDSESKTAFTTPMGQFCSRVGSMGNLNMPGTFQRCMSKVFAAELGTHVHVYLDNITLTTSTTVAAHAELYCWVLHRLKHLEMFVGDWDFLPEEVEVLGFVLLNGFRTPCARVHNPICNAPQPTSVAEVDRFFGCVQFLREHMIDGAVECSMMADVVKHR